MREKKIVFVIRSLGRGGAERVLTEISAELSNRGYQIYIITFNQEKIEYPLDARVGRTNLNIDGNCFLKFFQNIKRLKKEIGQLNCDICISFDLLVNLYTLLALAHRRIKLGISERSAPGDMEIRVHTKLLRKLLYWRADFYIFQTVGAKLFYSQSIQRRSYVIPNPVKSDLPARESEHIKKEIVSIGRLVKQKNFSLLLNAYAVFLKKHPQYILSIYGEGTERRSLEKLCQDLGIAANVQFMGVMNDVHEQMKNAEIFVMTSKFEGMPNALMEAMAMGFPVVATDCPCGGPAELISHGENGFLIHNIYDKNEVAAYLHLLCEYKDMAADMGNKASRVRARYSISHICDKWEQMLSREQGRSVC